MGRRNKDIKHNYKRYKELLDENKECLYQDIVLDQVKKNHTNTRKKTIEVSHSKEENNLELIVESKILNKKDFKFKLRAADLTGEPFFRFDSDGVSHMNSIDDIPLDKRKVDTPHFHRFNEDGVNIAYKTDSLNNNKEVQALLDDINLCIAHFCDESKTYHNNGYLTIVQTPAGELDFDTDSYNPLDGVNYE